MRIDGLNVYHKYEPLNNNKISEKLDQSSKTNDIDKATTDTNNTVNNKFLNGINTNKIITKQERQYFKQMFPESSELIEKHVLFNRNAKIQSPDLRKGQLIDGTI
ncbi:MAG TPA: hypothetical protein PLE30_08030 [Candidatus Kapabacteria bacterium]|nr:hypothetical protein [Candidatus Kapabacteria bacterium]